MSRAQGDAQPCSVMNRPRPKKRARRSFHPRALKGAGMWEDVEEVVSQQCKSTQADRDSLATWASAAERYCQSRKSIAPGSVESDEESGWDSSQIISDYESAGEDYTISQASTRRQSFTSLDSLSAFKRTPTPVQKQTAALHSTEPANPMQEGCQGTLRPEQQRRRTNSAPKTPTIPLCPLPPGLVFPAPPRISRPTSRSSSIASKRSARSSSALTNGKRETFRPPLPDKDGADMECPRPVHLRSLSAPLQDTKQRESGTESGPGSRFSLDSDAPMFQESKFGLMRLNIGPQPRTPTVVSPTPRESSRVKSVHQSWSASARSSAARSMPTRVSRNAAPEKGTPLCACTHEMDIETQIIKPKQRCSKQTIVFLVILWMCIGVGVGVGLIVKYVAG